jgi:uncharacterized protein YbjQ (UPF0145 family)
MAYHQQRQYGEGVGLVQPSDHHGVLISTGNDLPGYEIVQTHGVVYGITVRSRNLGANIGAALKSLVGGELKALTKNVVTSRDEALDRLVSGVRAVGGNAVYA